MRWSRGALGRGAWALLGFSMSCGSGQTGSPVSDPPEYETPDRRLPEQPDGSIDSEDGGGSVDDPVRVLPEPAPVPDRSAVIDDRLLVVARGELIVLDISAPLQPMVLGRLSLVGEPELVGAPSILQASSLAHVVVRATHVAHGSSEVIPSEAIPSALPELLEIDATSPDAMRIVRRFAIPEGSAGVVVRTGGYVALGGHLELSPLVGDEVGIADLEGSDLAALTEVTSLWLEPFGGDAPNGEARRELGGGHFRLSSDQTHVIRVGSSAPSAYVNDDLELEVIDLSSLESVYQVTVGVAAFGSGRIAPSADFRDGILVVAAGPRLLAFDVAEGRALPPISTPSTIEHLRFLDPNTLALDGAGSPLATLDRSTSTLSLVPVSGDVKVDSLLRFGDGYVAIEGGGTDPSRPLLRATRYAMGASGELEASASVQTEWSFRTTYDARPTWHVEAGGARLAYALERQDIDAGQIGVIELVGGQLRASNLADTPRMSKSALWRDDALFSFAGGVLQPLQLAHAASSLELDRVAPITLALDRVWFEREHAGLIWAKQRDDFGRSSFSVRDSAFSEPRYIELPHALDALEPLDENHLIAFGLSVNSTCEAHADACIGNDRANGVSLIAVEGGEVAVKQSFALSSSMLGEPAEGVERTLVWQGYHELAPSKWVLWGELIDQCASTAACAELGVTAYVSSNLRTCGSKQPNCMSEPTDSVHGALSESVLLVLDASDPDAPVLASPVRGGAPFRPESNSEIANLAPALLRQTTPSGQLWGYSYKDQLYDSTGDGIYDEHGSPLAKMYLQLVEAAPDASSVRFGERVNVPGLVVGLAHSANPAEYSAVTLGYDAAIEGYGELKRLRIRDGGAWVVANAALAERVTDAVGTEGLVVLLENGAEGGYALRVADLRGSDIAVSEPLDLSGYAWRLKAVAAPGLVELSGGPARSRGRLLVDVSTSPPHVVRYEY